MHFIHVELEDCLAIKMENSDTFWGGHLFSLRPGSLSVIEFPASLT